MFLLYDTAHVIFSVIFRPIFRFRVTGGENLPKNGPVILASNHASFLDPTLVGTALWRRVNFVAREDLFDKPWKRFILYRWKAIPVSRDRLDKGVLKKILSLLGAGEVVGLFPEGTRSPDDGLLPGKPGVGMIVSMAGAPVVPVYIKGSWKSLGKVHKKFRPAPITVAIGRPMEFKRADGESPHERYQRISDAIMEAIASLKRSLG